ncbi:MAG: hypothetical protein QOI42_1661 [Frankiaceae bacterium]|jgi:uncharacterized membrane protein YhaH (DUF805 family)|nr:hypothetical protein [Frankiaceae bacterium]
MTTPNDPDSGQWGTPPAAPAPYGQAPQYGAYPSSGPDQIRPSMGFGDAVRTVLNKYATFTGRASRPEYWFWVLAVVIVTIVLEILTAALKTIGLVLLVLFSLAVLVPGLAVAVRRLHDSDKSGWFLLLGLIPFVGGIVLLVFMCLAGTPGPNRYGPPA